LVELLYSSLLASDWEQIELYLGYFIVDSAFYPCACGFKFVLVCLVYVTPFISLYDVIRFDKHANG